MSTRFYPALLILGLQAFATVAPADDQPPKEVASLLQEFRSALSKSKQPSDKILEAEGSKIVAELIRSGRPDEAPLIGEQVRQKVEGVIGKDVHSELVDLFESYDKAVAAGTKPTRDRYLNRTDALIRSFEGKSMQAILELAKVRREILGVEIVEAQLNEAEIRKWIPGKYIFQSGGRPMKRGLNEDGTVSSPEYTGAWKIEDRKLRVDYPNGVWIEFDLPPKDGKLVGLTNSNTAITAEKDTSK